MNKKIIHIGLTLLYLIVLVKLPTYAHYCGETLVSISNCGEEDQCCDESKTKDTASFEASCCSDVELPNLIDYNYGFDQIGVKTFAQSIATNNYFNFKFDLEVATSLILKKLEYYNNFCPPTLVLYQLFNQYIIYY